MTDLRPLRIALFSDSLLPVLNGVSVSVDSLVTELRNRGHSVNVFAPRFPGVEETDPNTYRFRSLMVPFAKGFPIAYPPYIRMLRKFRRLEFDLIHTHTIGVLGFVGLRWAQSHELPIVSTYHTLYDRYAHYIRFVPRRYARFKIAKHTNFYYNSVDHVITPSHASERWLQRHSVTTPVTVIPTGARPPNPLDRFEMRRQLGIPAEQKVLLFVGRLAVEKNMETLFKACAIAIAADPQVRLFVVGDGPYHSECQSLVRDLGIGDRVRFAGFVPRDDVDRYYSAADLFVFASVTETQGLVIQEAMTYGLPAVVVEGGGASAGVQHGFNGLVTRNDAAELGQAVSALLRNDEDYSRLSTNALRSERGHGPSQMADMVIGVYRQVLAAKESRIGTSYASLL